MKLHVSTPREKDITKTKREQKKVNGYWRMKNIFARGETKDSDEESQRGEQLLSISSLSILSFYHS